MPRRLALVLAFTLVAAVLGRGRSLRGAGTRGSSGAGGSDCTAAGSASSAPATAAAPAFPPGFRLPDGVTPLAYDLRLEVDPNADGFTGHIAIRVRLDAPTDHVWIHADQLAITAARWDGGTLARLPVAGDQMIAFGFGRRVDPGEVTLAFDYTGNTTHDQEGLFRQQSGDRWYLFSQGESTLARRIAPCFDEPRFKTPWRVTLVAPADDVALANMPQLSEHALPDGRREIAFAPTPAMPSYLLAIAVGPFALVEVGTVGRGNVPVRVAALEGQADRVAVVARHVPAIVDALERYTDDALPWPKLDLVVVPRLFGAMENPGLVTFAEHLLVGDARVKEFSNEFVRVAAHELAHFWFGDLVTHAWWDDLWLAEAFASWLGDRTVDALGAGSPLDEAVARRRALEADALPTAMPLHRPVNSNDDPDASFDDTEYDKGQAVLATFEHWIGDAQFRAVVQAYLREHRGGSATAADFTRALAAVAGPDIGAAFARYVEHAGVPILELELDCTGAPKLVGHARDHLAIPACMRVPGTTAPVCALIADHAELPLASCPAWVRQTGGYYIVTWIGTRPADPPHATLALGQRVALGEDVELAVRRGELAPAAALGELRALAGVDLGSAVAAAAIARAIDPLVSDADRAAWQRWLAARFAARLQPATLLDPRRASKNRAGFADDLIGNAPLVAGATAARAAGGSSSTLSGHARCRGSSRSHAASRRTRAWSRWRARRRRRSARRPTHSPAFGSGFAAAAVDTAGDAAQPEARCDPRSSARFWRACATHSGWTLRAASVAFVTARLSRLQRGARARRWPAACRRRRPSR